MKESGKDVERGLVAERREGKSCVDWTAVDSGGMRSGGPRNS